MFEDQPVSEPGQSSPGGSTQWFWVGLIGAAICLIAVGIPAGAAGWAYTTLQNDNATATAQAVLPPLGWSLTMDEQFSSDRNHWDVGPDESNNGTIDLSTENESYEWQLKANSEDGILWTTYPAFDHPIDDFYVSVDCLQIAELNDEGEYGLVFRFRNNDNYFYYAATDNQFVRVLLQEGDDWDELLPWQQTDLIRPGEVNQLAVLAEGTHYRFFVNHQLVHELDDGRLSGGRIGLIANTWSTKKTVFQFDNFQLYEPEE